MKSLWNKFTDHFGTTIVHPQYIMLRLNRKAVEEAKKKILRQARGKLIDIGCGRMPYRSELEPLVEFYIGIDHPEVSKLYHPQTEPEVYADAKKLPFASNTFDLALMLQVLMYLDKPQEALKEAARVLKRGGYLILSSGFMYPIVDPPHDRGRYTDTALKEFLKNAGFKTIKIEPQGGFVDFWFQSSSVFLLKRIKDVLRTRLNLLSLLYLLFLGLISPLWVVISNLLYLALSPLARIAKYPNYFPLNFLVIAKKGE